MTLDKELEEEFSEFGVDLNVDALEKSVEICSVHRLSATDFVAQWMSFCVTKLNGAEPTVELLDDFERKQLNVTATKPTKTTRPSMNNDDDCYNLDKTDCNLQNDDVDFMSSYGCKKPIETVSKLQPEVRITDESALNQEIQQPNDDLIQTNANVLSGTAIYTFGNAELFSDSSFTTTTTIRQPCKISRKTIENESDGELLLNDDKFLYNKLLDSCLIRSTHIITLTEQFHKYHLSMNSAKDSSNQSLELPVMDFLSIASVSDESQYFYGRITKSMDVDRLDKNSIQLTGLRSGSSAEKKKKNSIKLDVSHLKSFGFYPGQVVMLQGQIQSKYQIMVERLFVERHLIQHPISTTIEPFNMIVVSGPYTDADNLSYKPLHDLMGHCKRIKPNALIMLGPFLDENHSRIECLTDTFDTYFEKMINGIMEAIGNDTKVVIVSSARDAHSTSVYPTHPYRLSRKYPNLEVLPDPSNIVINGFSIGLTSIDTFKHISDAEYSINGGAKIKRIVNYLLQQGTFYPLYPPPIGVSLDIGLWYKYAQIKEIPNMLLLPSDQKCFSQIVEKCFVLNPGRVAGNDGGGTLAHVVVSSPTNVDHLLSSVACRVIRI